MFYVSAMLQALDNPLENDGFKEEKKPTNFIFRLFKRKKNFFEKSCLKIESTLLSKMDRTDSSSGIVGCLLSLYIFIG